MADTAPRRERMTHREFLEWEARQPDRFEFCDGLVRMMAGGTRDHARIQKNALAALAQRLKGRPCEPFGSDMKVQTFSGAVYHPDLTIDSTPGRGDDTISETPTVIIEVLSRSTRERDLTEKLPNYKATKSVQEILFIETTRQHVMIWRREAQGWVESEVAHPELAVTLHSVDAAISMAEIYDKVEFTG
jgi:Uma2 family endonuclease